MHFSISYKMVVKLTNNLKYQKVFWWIKGLTIKKEKKGKEKLNNPIKVWQVLNVIFLKGLLHCAMLNFGLLFSLVWFQWSIGKKLTIRRRKNSFNIVLVQF